MDLPDKPEDDEPGRTWSGGRSNDRTPPVKSRELVAVLAALPLAGCLMGAELQVAGDPAAPTFTFRRTGIHLDRRLAFPGTFQVTRVSGGGRGEVAWYVNENRPCPPRAIESVRYGEPPPGATFVRGATPGTRQALPLVPGAIYRASVSGCGYFGGITFAVVDGKILSEQGTGDAALRTLQARLGR